MKRFFIIAFASVAFLSIRNFLKTDYVVNGTVYEVVKPCQEYPEGIVKYKDIHNISRSFEGSEDWLPGDTLQITLSDNATIFLYNDDYAVSNAIYTGFEY